MTAAPVRRLFLPALAGAVAVLWAGACGDDVQGPPAGDDGPSAELLSTLIVSNPVTSAAAAGGSLALSGFSFSEAMVFVSLPPGSVSNGVEAVIQTRGTEAQATAAMVDGGFDPVPVAAGAGDTLDIRIELTGGGAPLAFYAVVPPSIPPVIVRTDPPPKKRDVPLNAVMMIVFSEPIDAATVTPSSVQLLLGDVPVAGTLELLTGASLTLTFTPAEPLVHGEEYSLLITRDIADLDGDALAEELRVEFGTEVESGTTPALRINASVNETSQSIGVYRDGEIVDDAVVTLNGIALAHGTPGCVAGECASYHWGELHLSAGSPVFVEVRAGGVAVEATGSLPETPNLITPPGGTSFALADSIAVTWTSTTDPDVFWIGVSQDVWCCDLLASPPGTARDWKIAASDIGEATIGGLAIHVYGLNSGFFAGPADPESHMDLWSGSGESEITITTADPGLPGDLAGPLAFERDGRIYVVNADGTGPIRVSDGPGDGEPVWSPDGQRMAFTSNRTGQRDLYLLDADGAVRRTTSGDVHSPSWSPDGSRIAFSGLGAGHSQIQTIAVVDDGVGATVVVDRQGRNETPAWSPDGDAMLFVSDWTAFDFAYDIYVTGFDGSGIAQLTDGFADLTRYQHAAWSPDGGTIAFVYGNDIGSSIRFRVALMSADGAFVRDLAWAGDVTWFDADAPGPGSLTWSPDGLGIAYEFVDCDLFTGSGCSNERSVKYVSIDGSQNHTIIENARNPSWRR